MRVLVVAPHPDDETLGCGGSLLKHVHRGDEVHVMFLTSGELGLKDLPVERGRAVREAEAQTASRLLGTATTTFHRLPDWYLGDHPSAVLDAVRSGLSRTRPELVYAPHPGDAHPDHRAAARGVQHAVGAWEGAPKVLGYEVWTPLSDWDVVEDVSDHMQTKLDALACYASQLSYYRYDRAIEGLNAYRGALGSRSSFGEAFRVLPPHEVV